MFEAETISEEDVLLYYSNQKQNTSLQVLMIDSMGLYVEVLGCLNSEAVDPNQKMTLTH